MNINVGVLGLLALGVGLHALYVWWTRPIESNPQGLPWVPIDVRKTKVYVSKTRDAGMFIERQRRVAVLRNRPFRPGYKDFTNGVMDARLTGIAFDPYAVCGPPKPVLWSAGDADDEICDIVDAGGAFGMYDEIDFGGAAATVCDV
jgi:hypothetical protein